MKFLAMLKVKKPGDYELAVAEAPGCGRVRRAEKPIPVVELLIMEQSPTTPKTPWSFVALMAFFMSFVALSIDAMLPALGQIAQDLQVANPNDVQLVISSIFLGMGLGLVFFGPLSDSYGRKIAIYLGMAVFMVGCVASILASTFEVMLFGRLLQGLGGAACRVVTLAMIRDRFEGNLMAKVMSFIMIIFILVPALAPSIGQLILYVADWRGIFVFMLILSVLSLVWLFLGQEETLAVERRRPFSLLAIAAGIRETVTNRLARGYTVVAGLIFGAFIGYLSSSQQILQVQYALGDTFALVFGCLALTIGFSSFANSRWVDRVGMEVLCRRALTILVGISALFLPISLFYQGHPPLAMFLVFLSSSFFCFGILFGNFNTLAVQSLGHIAGVANSVIGSLQTLISVILGGVIGSYYNGTVLPLVSGFFILGLCSLVMLIRLLRQDSNFS